MRRAKFGAQFDGIRPFARFQIEHQIARRPRRRRRTRRLSKYRNTQQQQHHPKHLLPIYRMWHTHPRKPSVCKKETGSNFRRLCEISCLYPFAPSTIIPPVLHFCRCTSGAGNTDASRLVLTLAGNWNQAAGIDTSVDAARKVRAPRSTKTAPATPTATSVATSPATSPGQTAAS